MEHNGQLSFGDILIKWQQDGSLGYAASQKPTHTNLYLNSWSHHHPAQKRGVMLTLLARAHHVADASHLKKELTHLHRVFLQNGYAAREIEQTCA